MAASVAKVRLASGSARAVRWPRPVAVFAPLPACRLRSTAGPYLGCPIALTDLAGLTGGAAYPRLG